MNTARNETLQLLEHLLTLWNSHDVSDAGKIYAENYVGLDVTDHTRVQGIAGVGRQLARFYTAFPDLVFKAEEVVMEEKRAVMYWTARGTHQGVLLNIPPTGRRVRVNGVTMLCVENGKIVQATHLWDMAALLRMIGLLPELEKRAPLDTVSLKDALTICD